MYQTPTHDYYLDARSKGKKSYNTHKARGQSGHLVSLDGLLKDVEIVANVDLGTMEIPMKKVVGTYYNSRRMIFAKNFMPLESLNSEFGYKWTNLCQAHLNEGIRDPIKVYEYMNFYYVQEGNKRVSVLKYFDALYVSAQVIRLVPKYDQDDEDIKLYYDFLDFHQETNIIEIWMSKGSRYKRLKRYLKAYDPTLTYFDDKYVHFMKFVYDPFRKLYKETGGDQLNVTTGDAFVLYAKLYGIPDELDETATKHLMPSLIKELTNYGEEEEIDISTSSEAMEKTGFFDTITNLLINRKLKIGFVYARDISSSGWTYSHELGRRHVQEYFSDSIETHYVEHVPESIEAYDEIKKMAEDGFDVIFTTSEVFRRATLKCALEHPDVKFFNCSGNRPYVHMSNYFGRTHEPRFLTGLVAGAMTKTDVIGYTATAPTPERIAGINAFSLGVKLLNPYAKVHVAWTNEWNAPEKNNQISKKLIERGADIVSNKNLIVPRDVTWKYGIYSMLCTVDQTTKQPSKYLASPIWKWGIFYEKIIASLLNGTYQKVTHMYSVDQKLINFWWGMASGVIDIYYSKDYLPAETQRLIELMKQLIISDQLHPFTGPIYDTEGHLRVEKDELMTPEDILEMDWFVDNVILEKI